MTDEQEVLPAGWTWATVADLCEINPKHSGEHADTLPVSFVPMAAVDEQVGAITVAEDRPYAEVRKGYTHFADGDVLFAKITPCMENGKAAVARGLTNGIGCGTTEFFVLRSRGGVLPEYLHRFVRQESYRRAARQTMQSGVGQARVPKDFIEGTRIPVPPLAEQRRIVAKLDELLASSRAARAALDAVPALTGRLRQSIMARGIRGELTSTSREQETPVSAADTLAALAELRRAGGSRKVRLWGSGHSSISDEQLPSLPSSWCWARVGQLGPVGDVVQIGPMSMQSAEFSDSGRTVLNVGCIRDGWVDPAKADYLPEARATSFARYALQTGDVIFTRSGSVGRCAVLPEQLDGALMTFHLLRVRVEQRVCHPRYLLLALRGSAIVARQIREAAIGATRAGFNTRLLEELWIPLAPVQEQLAVVKAVDDLHAEAVQQQDVAAACKASLAMLDVSLLAKAFRGELVPQDPDDEPASVLLARLRAERASTPTPRARRAPARA